uniref:Uncharacterized protein n=1 Tax=Arundo donax TaxID=35708 RepID=A0A0A9AT30_ARUDO
MNDLILSLGPSSSQQKLKY